MAEWLLRSLVARECLRNSTINCCSMISRECSLPNRSSDCRALFMKNLWSMSRFPGGSSSTETWNSDIFLPWELVLLEVFIKLSSVALVLMYPSATVALGPCPCSDNLRRRASEIREGRSYSNSRSAASEHLNNLEKRRWNSSSWSPFTSNNRFSRNIFRCRRQIPTRHSIDCRRLMRHYRKLKKTEWKETN